MEMKRAIIAGLAGAAVAGSLAGCFDVDESVSLQRDLSGHAGFTMTVNLEPLVQVAAEMQHSMSGQAGPVTPEEVATLRRSMLDQVAAADPAKKQQEIAAQKAQLSSQLPAGVKLVSASMESEGLKMVARAEFSFDDVRKLAQIDLPQGDKGPASMAGPAKNPYSQPFSGLKVTDEGSTLLLTVSGADPGSRIAGQGGPGDAATKAMIASAFKDARFAFSLESPFEVVSTNATRREGHKLIWDIKLGDAGAVGTLDTLMARFKK